MECNCPKKKCERHGDCDACIAYHKTNKREPYCLRKSKKPRKSLISSIAVIMVLCLVLIVSGCNADSKYKDIMEMQISDVDINSLEDGDYAGEFSYGKNIYTVVVKVSKQKIQSVLVDADTKETNQKYVDMGRAVIDEVIRKQSLEVDTISGATRSSKSILKAIENALSTEK